VGTYLYAVASKPCGMTGQVLKIETAKLFERMSDTGRRAIRASRRWTSVKHLGCVTKVHLPREKFCARVVVSTATWSLDEEVKTCGLAVWLGDRHQATSPKTSQQRLGHK
jgi:hypothetical protein